MPTLFRPNQYGVVEQRFPEPFHWKCLVPNPTYEVLFQTAYRQEPYGQARRLRNRAAAAVLHAIFARWFRRHDFNGLGIAKFRCINGNNTAAGEAPRAYRRFAKFNRERFLWAQSGQSQQLKFGRALPAAPSRNQGQKLARRNGSIGELLSKP